MPELVAVRHVGFEDLGTLEQVFTEHGYRIRLLQGGIDDLSPISTADIAVILGGPIGVSDTQTYPWLGTELELISQRVAGQLPTLGICLGAQLMATALGAQVVPTGIKEIGYAPLQLTAAGKNSVLAPLDDEPVLHWHGDRFEIAPSAELLASTPVCAQQAFSVGSNLLGLQFHLEADPSQIERWLIGHACELAGAGIDPRTIRADAASYGPHLTQLAHEFAHQWIDGLQLD